MTETAPGRYRVEAPGVRTPALTAAVASFLAEHGAALTDLVAGQTLEDVYFEAVGRDAPSAAGERGRTGPAPGSEQGDGRNEPAPGSPPTTARTRGSVLRPLTAQTGAEIYMTLRRGETLLLTLGIPVVFLLFFSKVSVVSTATATPADFFVPGILALAVMSTAMVSPSASPPGSSAATAYSSGWARRRSAGPGSSAPRS